VTETTPKVVAFACRWSLGDESTEIGGVKLIPVLCSGRVSPGFILQSFEWGAAGVLVAGCGTKDCRYLFGAKQQEGQFALVTEIVNLLGIGEERIQLSWVKSPEELTEVATAFRERIEALGPPPIVPAESACPAVPEMADLRELSKAFACIDCGKCTGFCPVARHTKGYSPHRIVGQSIFKNTPEKEVAEAVWSCFTCGLCERRCPAGVKYATLQQGLRQRARAEGETGRCSHSGSLLTMMRIHAAGDLKQNRLDWVPDDVKVAKEGKTALYVGCAPYFDKFFEHMGVKTLDATKGAIRLLNAMGIEPVLMGDEVCCGHDPLWSGDRETFEKLAKKNVAMLKEKGIERVVHACAECYRTAAKDWAEVTGKLPFSNIHITELVATSKLKLNGKPLKATIQDPCRLSRHMGKADAIRGALGKSESVEIKEMMRHGVAASCCGSSSWLNCSAGTAALQQARLGEAKATGADVLLTACPKCEVHLACSQFGKDDKIEIQNVASVLAEALPGAVDAPEKSEG
jgi:heterodisulfide reductase subunit D